MSSKSNSVLKLSSDNNRFLLNLLKSLKKDVLINSIGDPIITTSDNRNTVVIGVNYYIPSDHYAVLASMGYDPIKVRVFIIYIIENIYGWTLTRSVKFTEYGESELISIACSGDGSIITAGMKLSEKNDVDEKFAWMMYDYRECIRKNSTSAKEYLATKIFISDNKDMFGYSTVVSTYGNRFYVSSPLAKCEEEYGFQGEVYELVTTEDDIKPRRTIRLPASILKNNKDTYLGISLELLNNDNTLSMTTLQGNVYTYNLNKEGDIQGIDVIEHKICYIDEPFEIKT